MARITWPMSGGRASAPPSGPPPDIRLAVSQRVHVGGQNGRRQPRQHPGLVPPHSMHDRRRQRIPQPGLANRLHAPAMRAEEEGDQILAALVGDILQEVEQSAGVAPANQRRPLVQGQCQRRLGAAPGQPPEANQLKIVGTATNRVTVHSPDNGRIAPPPHPIPTVAGLHVMEQRLPEDLGRPQQPLLLRRPAAY